MGFTIEEEQLTIEECIERFSAGGEWKIPVIARMTGWTKSMVYRYMREGKIPQEAIVRRSIRGWRIKGEALAAFLRELQK